MVPSYLSRYRPPWSRYRPTWSRYWPTCQADSVFRRIVMRTASAAALLIVLVLSIGVAHGQSRGTPRERTLFETRALSQQLTVLRQRAAAERWSFTPRITGVSDRTIESLTGELPPTPEQIANAPAINEQAERVVQAYRQALEQSGVKEAAQPSCNYQAVSWDWRAAGKVTKPKLQQ